MKNYPQQYEIDGHTYYYERILKDALFSLNILYRHESGRRYVLKVNDFRFKGGIILRPLAVWAASREYRMYQRIIGTPGIAKLGPRFGWRGHFHEYIEGQTLAELDPKTAKLPSEFFTELRTTIDEIHARRIYYLDLEKDGNIILGDDGHTYLIDFQICLYFIKLPGSIGRLWNRLFQNMIREDIYHLYKHKKRFQKESLTPEELSLCQRTPMGKIYQRFIGDPMRKMKRKIFPKGSDGEFKWNKDKDKK